MKKIASFVSPVAPVASSSSRVLRFFPPFLFSLLGGFVALARFLFPSFPASSALLQPPYITKKPSFLSPPSSPAGRGRPWRAAPTSRHQQSREAPYVRRKIEKKLRELNMLKSASQSLFPPLKPRNRAEPESRNLCNSRKSS